MGQPCLPAVSYLPCLLYCIALYNLVSRCLEQSCCALECVAKCHVVRYGYSSGLRLHVVVVCFIALPWHGLSSNVTDCLVT